MAPPTTNGEEGEGSSRGSGGRGPGGSRCLSPPRPAGGERDSDLAPLRSRRVAGAQDRPGPRGRAPWRSRGGPERRLRFREAPDASAPTTAPSDRGRHADAAAGADADAAAAADGEIHGLAGGEEGNQGRVLPHRQARSAPGAGGGHGDESVSGREDRIGVGGHTGAGHLAGEAAPSQGELGTLTNGSAAGGSMRIRQTGRYGVVLLL